MNTSDWSERYETDNTKWDLGTTPQRLLDFMSSQPSKRRILIPGCGRGYEIEALSKLGHHVCAIDYSEGAIRAAKNQVGALADSIICADFFDYDFRLASFDICYERTFLCALPEALRLEYGKRIASLLNENGLLIGIFHYGIPNDPDPPCPLTMENRKLILDTHFELLSDTPCPSHLSVFSDHDERWQVWRKRRNSVLRRYRQLRPSPRARPPNGSVSCG